MPTPPRVDAATGLQLRIKLMPGDGESVLSLTVRPSWTVAQVKQVIERRQHHSIIDGAVCRALLVNYHGPASTQATCGAASRPVFRGFKPKSRCGSLLRSSLKHSLRPPKPALCLHDAWIISDHVKAGDVLTAFLTEDISDALTADASHTTLDSFTLTEDAQIEPTVAQHMRALTKADVASRYHAAEALAAMGVSAKDARADLEEALLKDDSAIVRKSAALALGSIGCKDAKMSLLRAVQSDECDFVRQKARVALSDLGLLQMTSII